MDDEKKRLTLKHTGQVGYLSVLIGLSWHAKIQLNMTENRTSLHGNIVAPIFMVERNIIR